MHRNWWENFFHGVALDFWRAAVSEEQTRAEADFIQKQLQLSAGAKVLDVPCGNGRLSIELAQRGFQLTGVDLASEFIAEGELKSVAARVPVNFHERDMRDLPFGSEFDGAFCFGNSFGYLDDEGDADFVKAVSNALRPGAKFVIDSGAVAECLLPVFQEHRSLEFGGITLVADSRYDHELPFNYIQLGVGKAGLPPLFLIRSRQPCPTSPIPTHTPPSLVHSHLAWRLR